uniref:Uncharacterized protein n=1 Tax=Loa loa TaxID=7209 RepID=A0A1I7VPD8_LOALO
MLSATATSHSTTATMLYPNKPVLVPQQPILAPLPFSAVGQKAAIQLPPQIFLPPQVGKPQCCSCCPCFGNGRKRRSPFFILHKWVNRSKLSNNQYQIEATA